MDTLDILNLLCKIAFLIYGLITMIRINAYIKQKGK